MALLVNVKLLVEVSSVLPDSNSSGMPKLSQLVELVEHDIALSRVVPTSSHAEMLLLAVLVA